MQPVLPGPGGQVGQAAELAVHHLAVLAGVHDLLQPGILVEQADHLTDLHLGTGLFLGLEQQVHLVVVEANGLLHEDILAGLHSGNGVGGVQVGGQADVHGVNVSLLDQLHTGGVDLGAVGQLLSELGTHVGNGDHLDTQLFQSGVAGSVHTAHKAAANQTNFNHCSFLLKNKI